MCAICEAVADKRRHAEAWGHVLGICAQVAVGTQQPFFAEIENLGNGQNLLVLAIISPTDEHADAMRAIADDFPEKGGIEA